MSRRWRILSRTRKAAVWSPARLRSLARISQPVAAIEFCPQHQLPKPVQAPLNRLPATDLRRAPRSRSAAASRVDVQLSSMILMPPTKAISPSITMASLRCRRRRRWRRKRNVRCRVGRPSPAHRPPAARLQPIGKLGGTETIDENANRDAAASGIGHRCGDGPAGRIILEDVAFEMNFMPRLVDRRDQCRKILRAAVQQRQPVTGQKFSSHRNAPPATYLRRVPGAVT
jgi:hypothetical protein